MAHYYRVKLRMHPCSMLIKWHVVFTCHVSRKGPSKYSKFLNNVVNGYWNWVLLKRRAQRQLIPTKESYSHDCRKLSSVVDIPASVHRCAAVSRVSLAVVEWAFQEGQDSVDSSVCKTHSPRAPCNAGQVNSVSKITMASSVLTKGFSSLSLPKLGFKLYSQGQTK